MEKLSYMQNLQQLAYELRTAREAHHLSTEQAAASAPVRVHRIQALERGEISYSTANTLYKLAVLYGVDYLHLLRLSGHLK